MSNLIWDRSDLERFTKSDDAEARYWAIDRLIRHFPTDCCDVIAGFLLDDHDASPTAVARHLGRHGGRQHHAILVRGFRVLRGLTPGYCLEALARLGYPRVVELAEAALKRGDLNEPALAVIVETLAGLGTPEARRVIREYVSRKRELLAEPACLRGAFKIAAADEIPDIVSQLVAALHNRGGHRAGEAFRTLMELLQIDDADWCFRTGPSGHIELRKTIKAVESGYDCDISGAIGKVTINQIAHRLRAGNVSETIRAIADWTAAEVSRAPGDGAEADAHGYTERLAATVSAFADAEVLRDVSGLGRQVEQWLLGFQFSAAFAVARNRDFKLLLKKARGNLDRLLELAEYETAVLLDELPGAIAVVCREDEARSRKAQDWCLRMLEAQGPFFPKVAALETLGELGSIHFIPEVMAYLADENSYVYGAAERALSKLGESIIAPAVEQIEAGALNPDAAHSILVLLCDMGTQASYEAVTQHLDWFMDGVGPGSATEWVMLFGTEELIEPLRDWLDEDPAMIGQGLLLLGALHRVSIPEEDEILQAIEDDARERQAEESGDEGAPGGSDQQGGSYLM